MRRNRVLAYRGELREFARFLRKNSTRAEKLLWSRIRRKALGFEFHRQVPIARFIVDFYCHELMLAIEVDGSSHDHRELEDSERQCILEALGIRFIRFRNEQIMHNLDTAICDLSAMITAITKSQNTPPPTIQKDNPTKKS